MPKGNSSQATAHPDAVARRAYELYLQRGSEPGHETEDWLQAEAELAARERGGNDTDLDAAADVHGSSSDTSDASGASTDAPRPPGDSAAVQSRKGNGKGRPVRQPQSH